MFENKKIFVLGMGKSGVSVARLLSKKNEVLITDVKEDEHIKELENLGVKVVITNNQEELLDETYDYVIKNPGIRLDNKTVLKAEKLNIPVLTELEVGYRYLKNVQIIGITGSNGKTTTTTLIYEMLKKASLPVHLAGNIGYPLCDQIDEIKEGDILVIEISSHQLVNLDKLKTDVSVLTNLCEVHLDHFGTYENYKKVKLSIFKNNTSSDIAVLNKGDLEVYQRTLNLPCKKLYFSSKDKADIYIDGGNIIYQDKKIPLSDIRVKGVHNYENILAAILAVSKYNVPFEIIEEVLNNFAGVEHRI